MEVQIRQSQHELPTLLPSRKRDASRVKKKSVTGESHRIEKSQNPTVDAELLQSALRGIFASNKKVDVSTATASLVLLHDLLPKRVTDQCLENGPRKPQEIGRALLEKLFHASLPKDLVEIISMQRVVQPSCARSFVQLLATRGCALDLNIMFKCSNAEESACTPWAGAAHQQGSGNADEHGNWHMYISLVAIDRQLNHKEVLNVRWVTYRLVESCRHLDQQALAHDFQHAIDKEMDRIACRDL
jgi:hypothetical protein